MRKFRAPQPRQQLSLLPQSIDEFVTATDPVRFLDTLVDEFDLSKIEDSYSTIGRPGFAPRILTKILLYGKIRGIRSSRELSRACRENLRFMFLAQDEKPDFRTISEFRRRFLPELGELLKQTVEIGIEEGFITLEHVAIDGTKVRANASAQSFKSREKLEELLMRLEASLQEDVKRDTEEDSNRSDNDDGNPQLPPELSDKRKLSERVKQALKGIEGKKRISLTDSDANFMKSQAGCHPSYNGQFAVDEKSQMVVGAIATTAGSDHGELKPMLEEISATTGRNPDKVSADKGYRATEGLVELEQRSIEGFVPLQASDKSRIPASEFHYDDTEDEYICPAGQHLIFIGEKKEREADIYQAEDCSGCRMATDCLRGDAKVRTLIVSRYEAILTVMRERVASNEGKQMARARAKTVEPVFGWLKVHRKLRQFLVRGRSAVNDFWKLEAAALNVFRIVVERMKLKAQTA